MSNNQGGRITRRAEIGWFVLLAAPLCATSFWLLLWWQWNRPAEDLPGLDAWLCVSLAAGAIVGLLWQHPARWGTGVAWAVWPLAFVFRRAYWPAWLCRSSISSNGYGPGQRFGNRSGSYRSQVTRPLSALASPSGVG